MQNVQAENEPALLNIHVNKGRVLSEDENAWKNTSDPVFEQVIMSLTDRK